MYDCIMAMTNIIKNESPKTINNAFRGIDKFQNLEVQSPDTSVEENEQELILKFSLMKLTQNECANYETKPDKNHLKKNHQQNLTSLFSKK